MEWSLVDLRGSRLQWVLPCICLGLFWAAAAMAQPLRFRHLGIAEGLAQGSANAIAQGPHGLVWLGTEAGLQRYDGYGFVHYHHVLGDAASLTQDDVRGIAVAPDGAVWVATYGGGLDCLKPDRSGFVHYLHDPDDAASLSSDRLETVLLDRAGHVWAAGAAGVDELLPSGGFRHYRLADTSDTYVLELMQDPSGRIWVGTRHGLLYVDVAHGRLQRFEPVGHAHPSARAALATSSVHAMLAARDGRLWVGTDAGLVVLDRERNITAWLHHVDSDPASLADDRVWALAEDASGTLWVGTDGGGLDQLNAAAHGMEFLHHRHVPHRVGSLADDHILSLFVDATGLLWVGTYGNGFDIHDPRAQAFANILVAPDTGDDANNAVWAIQHDAEGDTWIGTETGLTRVGSRPGDQQQYTFNPDPAAGNRPAYNLYLDPRQRLWVGVGTALYRNEGPGTPFVRIALVPPVGGAAPKHIDQLLRDSKGRLWAASAGSLLRLDPDSGKLLDWYHPPHPGPDADSVIATLCQGGDGMLWMGTRRGMRRFDPGRGQFVSLPAGNDMQALASADVLSCLAAPDGLWIGTSDGLVHYRSGRGVVRVYDIADGLPSTLIYALLADARGGIWAGTGRGLVRVDPADDSVRIFGDNSGLANLEFNQMAAASAGGKLYFGGDHGVTVVDPANLGGGGSVARVAITGYAVSGRGRSKSYMGTPAHLLQLPYWQSAVTFDLAVLDYAAPANNRFRYRLLGFDDAWQTLQEGHAVTFTNLDPGNYTLQVTGLDSNGKPTVNTAALALAVASPPWQSQWAWIAYVVAGLLLVLLGLRAFASAVRRRRDLASEHQQRLWAEALRELAFAIAQLDDRGAVVRELMVRLQGLIPYAQAAYFTAEGDAIECAGQRGLDAAGVEQLNAWVRQHRSNLAGIGVAGDAVSVAGNLRDGPAWPAGRQGLVLPCHAQAQDFQILLLLRERTQFSRTEVGLAGALSRQVKVTIEKLALIQRLEQLAHIDDLTGTDRRAWFITQAEAEFARCRRHGRPLAMLLFDIDHFKAINDAHGHPTGDAVLVEIVRRCRQDLRVSDILGRYGGEEFVVCLPEADAQAALAIAERLRRGIAEVPIATAAGLVPVTVSIGVASGVAGPQDTLDALVARADGAMYAAKQLGRNRLEGPPAA